ncbi:MAG: hypothetical protein ACI4SM_00095 [Candidatus Gastranaerophilaceae bacterium]
MMNVNMTAPQTKLATQAMNNCCCNHQCECHNYKDMGQDTFVQQGIIAPRDWKPDPYAGLGKKKELTPQEKLKQRWEDIKRPMYANGQEIEQKEEKPAKKTLGQKISNLYYKLKSWIYTKRLDSKEYEKIKLDADMQILDLKRQKVENNIK